MRRWVLSQLFLLSLVAFVAQNASGGSAVAWDGHGHLVSFHGYPVDEAKRRALETARRYYGRNIRLIASTDIFGYGAIAVAAKGSGSVIGVALGKRSASEADLLAKKYCLNAGGTGPKIIKAWKG
jgi:hypothetical protein